MLRCAMTTADELCGVVAGGLVAGGLVAGGLVAGGVTVSVHIKTKHTVEQLNTIHDL